jgi:hypothetical protein
MPRRPELASRESRAQGSLGSQTLAVSPHIHADRARSPTQNREDHESCGVGNDAHRRWEGADKREPERGIAVSLEAASLVTRVAELRQRRANWPCAVANGLRGCERRVSLETTASAEAFWSFFDLAQCPLESPLGEHEPSCSEKLWKL